MHLATVMITLLLFLLISQKANLINPLFSMTDGSTVTTPTMEPFLMTDEWEVPPSDIIVGDSLGEGAFGEVFKGVFKGPIMCSKVRPSLRKAVGVEVAIKLLKCESIPSLQLGASIPGLDSVRGGRKASLSPPPNC